VVEVGRDDRDVARELGRKVDQPPVAWTMYAVTSAICLSLSVPLNGGMPPLPFAIRSAASAGDGFDASRSGPIVPLVPASFRT
jgi:hypothetical protein